MSTPDRPTPPGRYLPNVIDVRTAEARRLAVEDAELFDPDDMLLTGVSRANPALAEWLWDNLGPLSVIACVVAGVGLGVVGALVWWAVTR